MHVTALRRPPEAAPPQRSERAAPPPSDALADPLDDRIDDASPAERRLERLADAVARRTQLRLLQQKAGDDARQVELDRMREEFDFEQKEHAELLREFNLMRDLALEQTKKDDEAVKKWIALI